MMTSKSQIKPFVIAKVDEVYVTVLSTKPVFAVPVILSTLRLDMRTNSSSVLTRSKSKVSWTHKVSQVADRRMETEQNKTQGMNIPRGHWQSRKNQFLFYFMYKMCMYIK
jgi:hypothetical protein